MPDSKMKEFNPSREPAWHEQYPATSETTERPQAQEAKNAFPRWRKGLLALAGTSLLLPALLSACGGGEKESGVTVTTLIPTSTAAHETIEGGPPSTQIPIIESSPPVSETSSTAITPTSTSEKPSTQTPEVSQSIFDRLRQEITGLESTEQQELRVMIDKIETADKALTELLNLVNAHKEPNGTPTLVALQMAKFENIDPTPLYPSFSKEEGRRRMAQDEIFILRDAEKLAKLTNELAVSHDPNKSAHLIRQFNEEFFQIYQNGFYLEIGTKINSQEQWTLDDIEVTSDVSGPSNGPNHRLPEEDKAIILGVLEQFPKIENVRIILTNGYGAQVTFYPPPMPMEVHIGRDVFQLETFLLDELGGVFDIKFNYQRLAPYFSAEEIVRLLILREQAVEQERNFPSIQAMFGTKEDSESFHSRATNYPDALFIGQSEKYHGPLEEPLFAQYLKSPLLEEFTKETEGQGNPYFDWGAFTAGEKEKVEALKTSNPFIKIAFEHLAGKIDLLHNWVAISSTGAGGPLGSKTLDDYYQRVVPTYLNLALTEMFANSDPKLMELVDPLPSSQKQGLLKNFRWLISHTASELSARIFQQALLSGVDPNHPVQAYINLLLHQ